MHVFPRLSSIFTFIRQSIPPHPATSHQQRQPKRVSQDHQAGLGDLFFPHFGQPFPSGRHWMTSQRRLWAQQRRLKAGVSLDCRIRRGRMRRGRVQRRVPRRRRQRGGHSANFAILCWPLRLLALARLFGVWQVVPLGPPGRLVAVGAMEGRQSASSGAVSTVKRLVRFDLQRLLLVKLGIVQVELTPARQSFHIKEHPLK